MGGSGGGGKQGGGEGAVNKVIGGDYSFEVTNQSPLGQLMSHCTNHPRTYQRHSNNLCAK